MISCNFLYIYLRKLVYVTVIGALFLGTMVGQIQFDQKNGGRNLRALISQMQLLQDDTPENATRPFSLVFRSAYLSLLRAAELQTYTIACNNDGTESNDAQIVVSLKSFVLMVDDYDFPSCPVSPGSISIAYSFSSISFDGSVPIPPPLV